ncbi:MAG: tRNA 2-thiouridine(34) synthase MnmA [Acholeplasmataceae bacterium]|nr:tRNA 2-thiouridine(34) synthase MnmA [Acholeplasmataceae bacterium]
MKKKVILGLSGGVDSSVAAYVLKTQGYDVEGVFMRNWDSAANSDISGNPTLNDEICAQEQDYRDALAVARHLEIPLHRVDFVEAYWNDVFSYFLDEYKRGRTPNPDVLCNNNIKFKAFVTYAKTLDYDFIAMGHYARIEHRPEGPRLLRAADQSKDQTYFLSQLTEEQLKDVMFPIGDLLKRDVRKIAIENKIPTAHKKDSTGICFIGERDFQAFLSNYLPAQEGSMRRLDGTFLKNHSGLMNYTIGQRRGLGIGGAQDADGPWYVVGKDLSTNTLYVEPDSMHPNLYADQALITSVVWRKEKVDGKMTAKFRYRQQDLPVSIRWLSETSLMVHIPDLARAVTPGQVAAFYQGEVCVGSGTIEIVYRDAIRRQYV